MGVAVKIYKKILSILPEQLDALNNLGVCLIELEQPHEAIQILSNALDHSGPDAELLNNLGNALQKSMQVEEAIKKFELALGIQPDNVTVLLNISKNLLRLGQYNEALGYLEKARKLDPTNVSIALVDTLALPVIYKSPKEVINGRKRIETKLKEMEGQSWNLVDPVSTIGQTNFFLVYQGNNDKELQTRIASLYLKSCPDLGFVANHCKSGRSKARSRLRIGFVSAFLGSHTIGKLFRGLIRGLDPKQFEIFIFHLGPDRRLEDQDLASLSNDVEHFVPVPPQYVQGRQTIAQYEPDVLYYTDIGMEPLSYFLAFNRLAPVQCVSWGHPVTTGIPNIDYFISWQIHEPENARDHYSEKLQLFSGFCTNYSPPNFEEAMFNKGVLGLKSEENLYVCPQSLFKFHPIFDDLLTKILYSDENARIILLEGQQKNWGRLLKERFALGDPVLTRRISFLSRLSTGDYLGLMKLAKVVLDTPIFCGGNSSFEALAAGKVVITLPVQYMRGLFTSGIYVQMGLVDLIPRTAENYVELAVSLATDTDNRIRQENRIRERLPLIFNNIDTIHSHEQFFTNLFGDKTRN